MTTYRIGRHSENDIVIADTSVSRRHAFLTKMESGDYLLEDRDSMNGTFVREGLDWTQVKTAYIEPGGTIKLGGYCASLAELLPREADPAPAHRAAEVFPWLPEPPVEERPTSAAVKEDMDRFNQPTDEPIPLLFWIALGLGILLLIGGAFLISSMA